MRSVRPSRHDMAKSKRAKDLPQLSHAILLFLNLRQEEKRKVSNLARLDLTCLTVSLVVVGTLVRVTLTCTSYATCYSTVHHI